MRYLLWALLLFSPARPLASDSASDEIVVVGEGMAALNEDAAAAEEEAVWDAKRNAVEQAAGIFLRARAVGRDFALVEDEISSRTDGFVRRWEVVAGSRRVETLANGRILRLKVQAAVALLPVIRRLADMADVYDDLERPRVRIEVIGDSPAHPAQSALIAAFRAQGFEIAAESGPAEVVLSGHLVSTPTLRLGDRETPYGVGETVAACRAHLSVRVVSTASEEILLTAHADGGGRSFESDAEARAEAATEAAESLLQESANLFVQRLLVRWARERQEGHVVAIQATGLDARRRALLREEVAAMRGFRKMVAETEDRSRLTLRLLTRLDTRSVRRRLAAVRLDHTALTLLNDRGPLIVCAASARPRVSHPSAQKGNTR